MMYQKLGGNSVICTLQTMYRFTLTQFNIITLSIILCESWLLIFIPYRNIHFVNIKMNYLLRSETYIFEL